MPSAPRPDCPDRSPEPDHDLVWLSQVLSPPGYGVTPTAPEHGRPRDCLADVVEAQLAPASAQHEFLLAWAAAEGAGHA